MSDLIPQPHGGAIRPRDNGYRPANGPAANRKSIRAMRKEGTRLLADGTPRAAQKLLDAVEDEDNRVAAVAANLVLEHVRKVAEVGDEDEGGTLDEAFLTPEEAAHALECAEHLQRYVALVAERKALADEGLVIDAE